MGFQIGIPEQRFKFLARSFAPELQRFFDLLLLLATASLELIEKVKMHLAVAQFAGTFAQFIEELHCGLLFRIELGVDDLLPSLKTTQAGAERMSALRVPTFAQTIDGDKQAFDR